MQINVLCHVIALRSLSSHNLPLYNIYPFNQYLCYGVPVSAITGALSVIYPGDV